MTRRTWMHGLILLISMSFNIRTTRPGNLEDPTRANAFDPQASYKFKIDTHSDFEAEIAFHVLFTNTNNGEQTE